MQNMYGVEVTPELLAQGARLEAQIKELAEAWHQFELAATGEEYEATNTGEHLGDAESESELDVARLTEAG